ncbi:hypothetical protein [Hymenobacter sp. BT559]|uniref:hypothetical protein n=1 Tax=Hymenobacter sp. BT559 TaxID=2795729 RepID=UPI0018ED3EAF|nr:hypothetical protein [Hymenobacter sp. BT559]
MSKEILDNNEFQRRRVKSSSTVYSLLKSDIRQGCVIPPIVLALSLDIDTHAMNDEQLLKVIKDNIKKLIILDGLQRTYTIRDVANELLDSNNPNLNDIMSFPIRLEVYLGINKLGILYRMLTLNTGQSPMSIRHQIEILYSDYLVTGIEGIKLLKEVDDSAPKRLGEYKFKDVIDGFNSYLDRDYLSIDRMDILDNIKSLEKLSSENQHSDLFIDYVKSYNHFVIKVNELAESWEFDSERIDHSMTGQPFAKSVDKIFNKSQAMTGFGSAVGKLTDLKLISGFSEIEQLIAESLTGDISDSLDLIIVKLDNIRNIAKKIGNDQRLFFHFFFRELFDKKGDAYLKFELAISEAYRQYERRTQ